MGVITSLGTGKADNWARLTAGASGIHRHHPLCRPTASRPASRAPSISSRSSSSARSRLSQRAGRRWPPTEAIAESGIGARGDFPGPLFLAVPPVEIEWPQRARAGAAVRRQRRGRIRRTSCARRLRGRFTRHPTSAVCSARSPSISPTNSAPRARRSRSRPPARRARARSSSGSRRSAAARPMPRSASARDGSVNPEVA